MNFLGGGALIIIYHVAASIIAACLYLLLVELLILVFRIKKPSVKFFLYFLVLAKSLLLLVRGGYYSSELIIKKPFNFGFSLSDPLNIIPASSISRIKDVPIIFLHSSLYNKVILIVLCSVVFFLFIRWIAIAWFLRNIYQQGTKPNTSIVNLVKDFSAKIKTKSPNIIFTKKNLGPLTIGVINPVIIMPYSIVEKLNFSEIEVILAHELAHVKRKDNLWQWPILIMKDILLFNPVAIVIYRLLLAQKEIAADQLVLRVFPESKAVLQNTILKVSNMHGQSKAKNTLLAKASFAKTQFLQKRLYCLLKYNPRSIKNSILINSVSYLSILLFFWVNIWIAINFGKQTLMLLS